MCNLYRLKANTAEIAQLFDVVSDPDANYAEEVFPAYPGLVIAAGKAGAMTWGFPRVALGKQGQKLKPRPVTNARSDNLRSTFWRGSFEARRCLIPVSAWAEPKGDAGKMTRTWYSLPGGEPFAIGGLWRPTAEWGHAYAMVMVDASAQMIDVHDRMPVILRNEEWGLWVDGSPADAFALCQTWTGMLEVDYTDQRWGG